MAFKQALLATFLLFLAIHSSEGEGTLGTINEEKKTDDISASNEQEIQREWDELVGPEGPVDGADSVDQTEVHGEAPVVQLSKEQQKKMKEREGDIKYATRRLLAVDCKHSMEKYGLHLGKVMLEYCINYKEVMNSKHGNPIEVLDQFLPALKEAYAKQFGEPYAPPAKLKLKTSKSIVGRLYKNVSCLTVKLYRMVVNTKAKQEKRKQHDEKKQKQLFQNTIAKLDIYLAEAKAKIEEVNLKELQSRKDVKKHNNNSGWNAAINAAVITYTAAGLVTACAFTGVVPCVLAVLLTGTTFAFLFGLGETCL